MNLVGPQILSQEVGKEANVRDWQIIFYAILLGGGFFNRGETRADLNCKGKEPSVSDKLIIYVIGVIVMLLSHARSPACPVAC